jgi:ABC-2 type transport system permease protein
MRKILIIARRELAGYFVSPIAYVVGAAFLLASNIWFFQNVFVPGKEATLRPLFEVMAYLMVLVIPLLTMKLISEEFNSGTIEPLMTAPLTDAQVIVGKFLGVGVFYLILLATTVVPVILMGALADPDWGIVLTGYMGMVFLGAAYLAVGLFASTLTRYQLVAPLVGAGILSAMVFGPRMLIAYGAPSIHHVATRMDVMMHFRDFARGWFDSRAAVFLLSVSVLFVYLSTKALESRRWR